MFCMFQSSSRVCCQFWRWRTGDMPSLLRMVRLLFDRKDLALTQHEFLVTERAIYTS
jgi:hypothetical protein